jgi:type II secretory pathway component GspD/PulD (secretin)
MNEQPATPVAPRQRQVFNPQHRRKTRPRRRPFPPWRRIPPSRRPAIGTNFDELSLNFRNAPLEMVLNYLSDAAGFIIVLDTQVKGNVSVISSHPMTRNEAVDLLNSVLNKNGYAAIRDGRTLTILDKNDAKTRNIPVKTSNNPDSIPNNAEIVTQIIPIRFVEARQLVTDLSSFVSPQATIVANEAGNSIVVTDTQSNIRHLTEIIRAIDNSAEGETEIRVFHLKYASPADVASELGQIFPTSGTSGNQASRPFRFGGGGGGRAAAARRIFQRMMAANAGGGTGTGGSQNSRIQKQTQVIAVADQRTSSVIVTASKDLMQEIAGMMNSWMCLRTATRAFMFSR